MMMTIMMIQPVGLHGSVMDLSVNGDYVGGGQPEIWPRVEELKRLITRMAINHFSH